MGFADKAIQYLGLVLVFSAAAKVGHTPHISAGQFEILTTCYGLNASFSQRTAHIVNNCLSSHGVRVF